MNATQMIKGSLDEATEIARDERIKEEGLKWAICNSRLAAQTG